MKSCCFVTFQNLLPQVVKITRPRGYQTLVHSQTQNKAQWLAVCWHVSASSQSLRFILSLSLYSSFITSRPVLKPHTRKSDKTKMQVSFIWFITVMVSKGVYEYFLANSCLNLSCECFLPSIRLFMKMLQIREFVNSPFCGCCIIQDFVPINRNVSTGNVDTTNAAYTSQKEQNYLWLPFYLFN